MKVWLYFTVSYVKSSWVMSGEHVGSSILEASGINKFPTRSDGTNLLALIFPNSEHRRRSINRTAINLLQHGGHRVRPGPFFPPRYIRAIDSEAIPSRSPSAARTCPAQWEAATRIPQTNHQHRLADTQQRQCGGTRWRHGRGVRSPWGNLTCL
jgi:hypothetical protein